MNCDRPERTTPEPAAILPGEETPTGRSSADASDRESPSTRAEMSGAGVCPTEGPPRQSLSVRLEEWLDYHFTLLAVALVLGGTIARLLAAIPGYLNPDEILHVLVSSGSDCLHGQ